MWHEENGIRKTENDIKSHWNLNNIKSNEREIVKTLQLDVTYLMSFPCVVTYLNWDKNDLKEATKKAQKFEWTRNEVKRMRKKYMICNVMKM